MKTTFAALALALACAAPALGASVTALFAGSYTLVDIAGPPAGVAGGTGGLAFSPTNPNVLYFTANWDTTNAQVFSVGLARDAAGHIDGFNGPATFYATDPAADDGLVFAVNGTLLFNTGPTEIQIGQIKPGSTSPDALTNLPGALRGGCSPSFRAVMAILVSCSV